MTYEVVSAFQIVKMTNKEVQFQITIRLDRYRGVHSTWLAPKIGPLGLSPKKVSDEINAFAEQNSCKHVIQLIVYTDRTFAIVNKPDTSDRILHNIPIATNLRVHYDELRLYQQTNDKVKNRRGMQQQKYYLNDGSVGLHQIVVIARKMYLEKKTTAKSLTAAVLVVLGSCVSIKCKVNGKDPKYWQQQISDGLVVVEDYLDEELYSEKTIF
jgi:large subunit ribosomal protein L12e